MGNIPEKYNIPPGYHYETLDDFDELTPAFLDELSAPTKVLREPSPIEYGKYLITTFMVVPRIIPFMVGDFIGEKGECVGLVFFPCKTGWCGVEIVTYAPFCKAKYKTIGDAFAVIIETMEMSGESLKIISPDLPKEMVSVREVEAWNGTKFYTARR